MGIHDGHRERLKQRFKDHGLDNFHDLNVLELLLCYAIPRGDVNPTAHGLMEAFGSLSGVFDAPIEELEKVKGIGRNSALLIKLVTQLYRRYKISRRNGERVLDSSIKAGEFITPYFISEQEEVVYLICLDAKCKLINCRLISRGNINTADISTRKIVENALLHKSSSIIIAHNHTSGVALPSRADLETTRNIEHALKAVDIILADHIIVADDDFVSLADNGYL